MPRRLAGQSRHTRDPDGKSCPMNTVLLSVTTGSTTGPKIECQHPTKCTHPLVQSRPQRGLNVPPAPACARSPHRRGRSPTALNIVGFTTHSSLSIARMLQLCARIASTLSSAACRSPYRRTGESPTVDASDPARARDSGMPRSPDRPFLDNGDTDREGVFFM